MQLETPPLAERPYLLGVWKTGMDSELAASCLFGIYNGWIDLHTLREYMRMLEVDSRPESLAKMAAHRLEHRENTEETGAMDTGGDETMGRRVEGLLSME